MERTFGEVAVASESTKHPVQPVSQTLNVFVLKSITPDVSLWTTYEGAPT